VPAAERTRSGRDVALVYPRPVRILVTGSNGFIGSRIAALALARGWQVVGLGRSSAPAAEVSDYVSHDISRPLPSAILVGDVDAVVHCAALASPWAPPRAMVAANVMGTRNVADWAQCSGSPRLVYVSSSSVLYRDCDQLDLNEASPVPPDEEQINVYSRTKRIGERAVERYAGQWVVLRPRAVFGPGDTVLLPRVLRAAGRGILPVLELREGPTVRCDVTFVDTVAHYCLEAVSRPVSGTYQVTNAEPIELYPFLLGILGRMGVHPKVVRVPVGVAAGVAGIAERVSAALLGYREPPLTRYGVSVLSRSKTFDVARCLSDLGAPAVSLDEGVERLVAAHG
jgi:nucleoside-diphosphate-sugar epimerase